MECIKQLLICIFLFIFNCDLGLHALSSNDSVKILFNNKTQILDSNGSKNNLFSRGANGTSNGLALRYFHGKNKRLWQGAATCQDGKACGQDCCRYKVKMSEICREGNCWGGSVDIVVRGFRLPQRLRKIFLDVVNWFRDMWYTFMRRNHEVVRLPDINRFKLGENSFISMNQGFMKKRIFMHFSGPITLTKHRNPLHILESFDIQLPKSWFGYEFNFYLEQDGGCQTRGKVYIESRNILIKLFLMAIKKRVCAASRFTVNMDSSWSDFATHFDLLDRDGILLPDEKVSKEVKNEVDSFIAHHLFAQVLEPAVKNYFSNFMQFTTSLVYTEFKYRSIDLCKEVRHLFD